MRHRHNISNRLRIPIRRSILVCDASWHSCIKTFVQTAKHTHRVANKLIVEMTWVCLHNRKEHWENHHQYRDWQNMSKRATQCTIWLSHSVSAVHEITSLTCIQDIISCEKRGINTTYTIIIRNDGSGTGSRIHGILMGFIVLQVSIAGIQLVSELMVQVFLYTASGAIVRSVQNNTKSQPTHFTSQKINNISYDTVMISPATLTVIPSPAIPHSNCKLVTEPA